MKLYQLIGAVINNILSKYCAKSGGLGPKSKLFQV